jgi:hypothetical protein
MMALSENTIAKLSEVLSRDVAEYISQDERFFDLMVELIPDAIHAKLGPIDDQVGAQLMMYLSERLILKGV